MFRKMPFVFINAVYTIHCEVAIFVLKTYCEVIARASHKFIGDFTTDKSCSRLKDHILELYVLW